MSFNNAILVGRLGKDFELRYTQSGTAVGNFSLATDHYAGKEKGKVTEWHTVVLWGKLAESLAQYLVKGAQVLVEGRITSRQWQDKEGATRKTTEIVASEVRLLGGKRDRDTAQESGHDNRGGGYDNGTEDDLPF